MRERRERQKREDGSGKREERIKSSIFIAKRSCKAKGERVEIVFNFP